MGKIFSLKDFYQQQINLISSKSPLEMGVEAVLAGQSIDLGFILDSYPQWEIHASEEKMIKNWKSFVLLALLKHFSQEESKDLGSQIRLLLREPWNEHSHELRVLIALSHYLMGLPVPQLNLKLLEGGAILVDRQEYCPWLALPYLPRHAELGVLFCLFAFLTKREDLKESVKRLVHWHLNTLDHQFLPLAGLFVQEKDGDMRHLLIWNYLLFYGAAQLTKESHLKKIAQVQLEHLNNLLEPRSFIISPLLPLLEKAFGKEENLIGKDFHLSETIYDSSTALIGSRLDGCQAVCTLHGGYTGLGSFRNKDVEILNYGPQYLPLSECSGFGIEGNYFSDHGLRKTVMRTKGQGFFVKGCVRVVDQPEASPWQHFGQFRGVWLEIEQEFKEKHLSIQTNFIGLNGWETLAFSFFVKAAKCSVSSLSLFPRTFDRYEGKLCPLIFEGKQGAVHLATSDLGPGSESISMQVIPLGGGSSFWGADFLVAYLLDSHQSRYQWQIQPYKVS